MSIGIVFILIFVLAPVLVAGFLFYLKFAPKRKKEKGFEFVYVEKDGSVREVYHSEVEYLNRPFYPGTEGRPFVKKSFDELNPKGNISGFILRSRVPKKIFISKKGSGPVNLN